MASTVVNLAVADFQTLIGDIGVDIEGWEGSAGHAALHSLVGCAGSVLTGGNCASGAIGGLIQSVYAGAIAGTEPTRDQFSSDEAYAKAFQEWEQAHLKLVSFLGSIGGFITSGGEAVNVNNAGNIARSGLQNNYLSHVEVGEYFLELGACESSADPSGCEANVYKKYDAISLLNRTALRACEDNSCVIMHQKAMDRGLETARELAAETGDVLKIEKYVSYVRGQHQNASLYMANFQSAGNTSYEKAEDWKNANCESRGRACDIEYVATVQKEGDDAARLIADFVPILGDIKGFIEAEDGVDILLAVAGILPGVSESKAIVKLNKAAEGAGKSAEAAQDLIKKIEQAKNPSLPTPVVVSKMPDRLNYETTSGVKLVSDPNKTTTILGNYGQDTKNVIGELGYPKTLDFGEKKGGFNVLNTPDSLYENANQFWNDYNKPFLDEAIKRGDNFPLVTKPAGNVLNTFDDAGNITGRSGFGREFDYLTSKGYQYDPLTSIMVKP